MEAVRQNEPGIVAARAEEESAKARQRGWLEFLSPRVRWTGSVVRSDDPALLFSEKLWQGRFTADDFALDTLNFPPPSTAWQTGLVAEQPLFNGGIEFLGPRMESHSAAAAQARAQETVSRQLLGAAHLFLDAWNARETVNSDSTGYGAAEEHHRASVALLRTGQVAEIDTLRSATRLAESRAVLAVSRGQLHLALLRLSEFVGTPVEEGELVAPLEILVTPDPSAERPELVAAEHEAEAAQLSARHAGLNLLPSLNSSLQMNWYSPEPGEAWERRWRADIYMSLPLWDAGRTWKNRRAAQASARATSAHLEERRREVALEVERAKVMESSAREEWAATKSAEGSATEALRLSRARYAAGLLAQGELLLADAEATRARSARIRAQTQILRAQYALQHARGVLR